ncbi:MAG: hypothetical protein HOH74_08310, partial [Gemmatimonadetes bacterium]|nr:hypothetical protein [Gemmatimonadota bacterium]
PADETWGLGDGAALLKFVVVMGPGTPADRARSGTGVVAILRAICTAPIQAGQIAIFNNAIHQTRVVLADGLTELGTAAPNVLHLSAAADAPVAARNAHSSWGQFKLLSRLD